MNKLPFIILGVINTIIFMKTGQVKKAVNTGEEWTVYGTTWCGWTTKQLKYFEKKELITNSSIAKKANATELSRFHNLNPQPVKSSSVIKKYN